MPRPLKTLIFAFLLQTPLLGGAMNIDSAKRIIAAIPEGKKKVQAEYELVKKLCYTSPSKAVDEANEMFLLAKKIKDTKGMVSALNLKGMGYENMSEYKKAYESYNQALELTEDINEPSLLASIYNNTGINFKDQSYYKKALQYYYQARTIYIDIKDIAGEAGVLNNIGTIYRLQRDYAKAYEYFLLSLNKREQIKDTSSMAGIYNNIGNLYKDQKKYSEALSYYEKARKLNYKKQNAVWLAINYENIGNVYTLEKNFIASLTYLDSALVIRRQIGDNIAIAATLEGIGRLFITEKDFQKSIDYFNKALALVEGKAVAADISGIYKGLSEAYTGLGDYKQSIVFYKKYDVLNDSISQMANQKVMDEASLIHEMDEQENELDLLKRSNDIQNMMIALGGLMLVITGFFSVVFFNQNRRNKKLSMQLMQQNNIMHEQNLFLEHLNKDKNEFLSMATHDLRSPLNSITLSAKLLKGDVAPYNDVMVNKMVEIIGQTAERMSKIISDMFDISRMESGNMEFDIKAVNIIEICKTVSASYANQAEAKNIIITNESTGGPTYVLADENALYQIIDNLLSNAVKYTYPGKSIVICVSQTAERIYMSIKDEGPGLTEVDLENLYKKFAKLSAQPTAGETSTGLGLSIVKRLVDAINAEIKCTSRQGEGTTFTVILKRISQQENAKEIKPVDEDYKIAQQA